MDIKNVTLSLLSKIVNAILTAMASGLCSERSILHAYDILESVRFFKEAVRNLRITLQELQNFLNKGSTMLCHSFFRHWTIPDGVLKFL